MKNSSETRKLIIEKSALLFNRKGYAGTSIQDITKEIGMTKGSIYRNFENKNEISIEAFKYNILELNRRLEAYTGKERDSIGQLMAITRFYRQDFETKSFLGGCPIMNAAIDSDDTHEELKKVVHFALNKILGIIGQIIQNGLDKNEIKNSIIPENYAVLIFSLIEGGLFSSKTTESPKYLFQTCDRIDKINLEE